MNAVYLHGTGSMWNDWEIQYSIRSVRKYAPFISDIFSVGIPAPGTKNIPHQDTQHPAVNIWEKIVLACMDDRVSDPFMLLSDDHFLIAPISMEYPNYFPGRISQWPRRPDFYKMRDPYSELVDRTQYIIGDVLWFNVHCPVLIHKQSFLDTFNEFRPDIYSGPGLLVKTTYLRNQKHNIVPMADYKTKPRESAAQLTSGLIGRHVFSTDTEISDAVADYLIRQFGRID